MHSSMRYLTLILTIFLHSPIFGQSQNTLQPGTYNAPAGTGAYMPANPDILGTNHSAFMQNSFPSVAPNYLNSPFWNWIQQYQLQNERKPLPPQMLRDESLATFTVLLPQANANVWANNKPTKQQGRERVFRSPPLEPGTYRYRFRASWSDDKNKHEIEKVLDFAPGDHFTIDFSKKDK